MAQLRQRIALDLERLRRTRGLNSLGALLTSSAELLFAGLSLWYAGTRAYETAALFGSLSGFATLADSSLRFREGASAAHARIVQLRVLALQVMAPPNADPLWEEYDAISAQDFSLSYATSLYELVSPPAPFSALTVDNLPGYASAADRAASGGGAA